MRPITCSASSEGALFDIGTPRAAPVQMLDTKRDAPAEYYDKLTVAKTFALAIDEAAKLPPNH